MVMEGENDNKLSNRPYPPVSNVVSVLQKLRTRNLPEVIDAEYLRDAGIPEGTIGRTLLALKFIGVINEFSQPAEALKAIHTSTDEEYKLILAGLIKESYKEIFNVVDPAVDPQSQILNVFRRYTPASQRERMVAFFLGMCREAGISTLDAPKVRSMVVSKVIKTQTKQAMVKGKSASQLLKQEQDDNKGNIDDSTSRIYQALDVLIKTLPQVGTPMSADRRKQWLNMADAVLKFVYPETPVPNINAIDTGNQNQVASNEEVM